MLGRLRMSLQECENAYIMLSEKIFTPNRKDVDPRKIYDFLKANGKFDEKPLETSIKQTVREKTNDENALLREFDHDPNVPCRVYV